MNTVYDEILNKSETLSVLEETVYMVRQLPEEDLKIVNSVVKRFIVEPQNLYPFKRLSKEEFYDELAKARLEAEKNKVIDGRQAYEELKEKYGL